MDILRALTSPNMDVRRKCLDIALDLLTPRNIDEVVLLLKKEGVKTESKELERAAEYRQMLIQVGRVASDVEWVVLHAERSSTHYTHAMITHDNDHSHRPCITVQSSSQTWLAR